MRKFITLVSLAALIGLSPVAASANDRYGTPPPLRVSLDLSAPWVMQLRRAPAGARAPARVERRMRQGVRVSVSPRPQQRRVIAAPGRSHETAPDRRIRTSAVAPGAARQKPRERVALDPQYLPQVVDYDGAQKAGTIIIDTNLNFLYLVETGGKARRYGVGTGKPGFEWSGTHSISQKKQWPDWRPPAEMITREAAKGHYLPTYMAGGPENPLGARALYLGSTLYRIHGTNQPWTIGRAVSSGCIRMRNEDVIDLYERVGVGTKVVVI